MNLKELFPFYTSERVPAGSEPQRGQLWRAPSLYLDSDLDVLHLDYYDPTDESRNRYSLRRNPKDAFDHRPVKEIGLRRDEALLVKKAKQRPVVILSERQSLWEYARGQPREASRLVAPLYSFKPRQVSLGQLVQQLALPELLYLPADEQLGLVEGYLRLDRIYTCLVEPMEPMHIRLSEDAMWMVDCFVGYYLGGQLDPFWVDLRTEMMASL